jgi:hypothetical protein
MEYQVIETGLDLGTKFLTPETAYFLGLLQADEREVIGDTVYWVAPIRHNPKHFEINDLEQHYSAVKQIAKVVHKEEFTHMTDFLKQQGAELKKYNLGKKGIVTLFEEKIPNYDIDTLIRNIEEPLLSSDPTIVRAFLVGVFDGRGSYDKTAKFIALDYDNGNFIKLVEKCLKIVGIDANINNTASARRRKDSSAAPRKSQLRIKHLLFLTKIGFVSNVRFNKATIEIPNEYSKVSLDQVLTGLKGIQH